MIIQKTRPAWACTATHPAAPELSASAPGGRLGSRLVATAAAAVAARRFAFSSAWRPVAVCLLGGFYVWFWWALRREERNLGRQVG
jgi:hypothetical protein